jgi:hypothetical protein
MSEQRWPDERLSGPKVHSANVADASYSQFCAVSRPQFSAINEEEPPN